MAQNSPSNRISCRDFIKATTAAIGGLIGLATSLPVIIHYQNRKRQSVDPIATS